MLDSEAILNQSKSAYNQWAIQWRENAKAHSKFKQKSFEMFQNIGVGKAILCVANGYSFEENLETIKTHHKNVDILACDKTLGHLIDNGISPAYVVVCDANVNYEKYMEKWKDKLSKTILFINVCANPKWTSNGNWKDIIFFTNTDIIDSQLEFGKISGCSNSIPAATNVSNAMVVLLTQSDNSGRNNFFGYDKILLIGFDYSWKVGGKYYAFDETGDGKASYMRHAYNVLPNGEFCYTSGNLTFSLDWLKTYVNTFKLPVIQCSETSLLCFGKAFSLESQMQYRYKIEDQKTVSNAVMELKRLEQIKQKLVSKINEIGRDHYWSCVRTT